MITIKGLLKSYGDHFTLGPVDLHIGKGVVYGLIGPNGAGKTTLISILNGLCDYQDGSISLFDLPLCKNLKEIRRRSSFIPQSLALYDNLTVMENLRFFASIQNIRGDEKRRNIDYAVDVNRLDKMVDQKAGILSGGQKRRLNIAIGLLNNPELLYFDEPTVGIDPESRNEILDTILSFKNENKTVVYTSHYMVEVEKICDEAAIIDCGRIVRQGRIEDMLREERSGPVVLELLPSGKSRLNLLAQEHEGLEVIDTKTLILYRQTGKKMVALLNALDRENIELKQISYGTVNLESLFIRLTSRRCVDV